MSLHEEYFEPLAGDHHSLVAVGLHRFEGCELPLPGSVDVEVPGFLPLGKEIAMLL